MPQSVVEMGFGTLGEQTKRRGNMEADRQLLVYAINGSARKRKGQTAHRLESIGKELGDLGVNVKTIHLAKEKLTFCDGVQTPKRRADIKRLLTKLEAADGLIFGTPTYWFNMSALMKNLLERLTVTEDGWTLEGKVAGFVGTGSKHEDGAMIALSSIAATVDHLGMVTFPYSMMYFRGTAGPAWAKRGIKGYAKRMFEMMRLLHSRGRKSW
jgi:multimeric flavodoxin WrbA